MVVGGKKLNIPKSTSICDEESCKKEFILESGSIQRRGVGNGIQQLYFVCPHCNREYPVTKINKSIEALRAKIDYYSDRIAKTKDQNKKTQFLQRLNEAKAEKKRQMEELNGAKSALN